MGLVLGSCEGLLTWTLLLLLSAQSHGKRCPVPVIENGDIQTTGDLRLGETVTFVCNKGFRMIGPNTARCTLYESSKVDWNRQPPECERIPCPRPPRIANGRHDGDEGFDHYDYGTVVTYTCEKDFTLIGTASIFCTSNDGLNGNWDRPAPECKVVVCQRPEIANGRLTSPFQATYKYNHMLRFECNAGHTLVGSEFVKCGADNKWHPALPSCVKGKRCPVPVIENGDIQTTGDLRLGETVTFVCNKGFRMIGPNTARCTLYESSKVDWNRQPPECERIPCPRPPRIANGRHDGDEGFDHYDYGTVVTYTCEKDFTLIGTASIFCTSNDGLNGNWDRPAPECKVVVCQRPEIANGRLTSPFQATYKYNHMLRFECNAGHTLVGSEFVKCGADNKWHPALPSCVKGIYTTDPVPPGDVTEKSLEDRLANIEKKLDLILLKVSQSCYQQTRGEDEQ